MKKTYTITYAHHTSVYKQIKVQGTMEQAERYAPFYATQNHLMATSVIIREVE